MANGSRHSAAYVEEVTYGVTPATPVFTNIRHTALSLGLSRETLESAELRADRMTADARGGTQQVAGDIEFELSYGSFDALLAAVFCGTWVTGGGGTGIDRLKAGTTRRSFTIERHFQDITDKPYHRFTGCEFNTLELAIAANAIVTGTLGVIGKGMTANAAIVSGATYPAASATGVLDSFSGTLKEGGATLALITEASIQIENGLEPRFVVGSRETIRPSIGRSRVSGSATFYFENSTMLDKFINETESSISLTMPDLAGNAYELVLPRVKYMGGQPDVSGEGPILLTMPFMALLDDTTDTNIYLDRNPA